MLQRIFRMITATVILFLAIFFYQAYSLYRQSVKAQNWVAHTNVIINRLENIYASVWQLQSAFGEPVNAASQKLLKENIRTNYDTLALLTRDNPQQFARLKMLGATIGQKFALMEQPVTPAVKQGLIRMDDKIKQDIGLLIGTENNLLSERTASFEYYSRSRFIFSILSFFLLGLFLFISLYHIYKNLQRRANAERLAIINEEKYRQLVENSQFVTCIIGLDGIITFASKNIEQLTGYPAKVVVGVKADVPLPPVEDWNSDISFISREIKIPVADGTQRWISYRLSPLRDAEGKIVQWQTINWDIDYEKRMEEEVAQLTGQREHQQKLMQDIIDNIPSAVYIKDKDGRYVVVNKKFGEIFGVEPTAILGRVDTEVFSKERRENYQIADEQVRAYKTTVTLEDVLERSGRKVYFWVMKFPLLDNFGEVQNICGLATDITERKENELKLMQATRAADSARIAQESFLANMSHEIRTPMNGIMGMTNLLLSTAQTEEQHEYADNILESARHLLAIINDILDFSKIKAGKFHFEHIAFKPRHVLKKAIYPLQFKADEKMVKLVLSIEGEVPDVLLGDPLRLQQIMINLVGNALKFTSEGTVQVMARCTTADEQHCMLEVKVADTGIGIPQDKLQMIFESFTQNNVNTSRKYGGTGLGLAIVKQLVELQGGRVWVESTPDKGSVFGFEIRYEIGVLQDHVLPVTQSINTGDEKLLEGISVLVAEDNLINQKVVSITLGKQGAKVHVAANGLAALDALRADNYDIVLMDLQMPEMDGYKATRMIRRELDGTIPIIAMTADALKGEAERCFEAGMNGYISKPFEPRDLYQEILLLTQKRMQQQELKKNQMKNDLIDFTYLEELSGNDPAYISEVLNLFLGTMPEGLEQLEQLAKNTSDWDAIHRQAHFLKSSVSVIRIRNVFDNLTKIEAFAKEMNKAALLPVMDEILAIYNEAHPLLIARRDQAGTSKI